MPDIILSIHKEHAENILRGSKREELRKTRPERMFEKVYLCETGSGGKIIGEVCLAVILKLRKTYATRDLLDYFCRRADISIEEFIKYIGDKDFIYRWVIKSYRPYKTPRHISDFGRPRAPQSWCYVKETPDA